MSTAFTYPKTCVSDASSPSVADSNAFDEHLLDLLACPRDKRKLAISGKSLTCPAGHEYPIVDGVPVFLLSEVPQTHVEGNRSLAAAAGDIAVIPKFSTRSQDVDPFVKNAIGATNGSLYQHLVGNLNAYPIPQLDLPPSDGELLLEIGCSWGRWCIAAARLGYLPIGIDPSLKSILAARRVAQQLGVKAHYLVADGRHMPFRSGILRQVFSYSVLQHLSEENVRLTLNEARRVLNPSGGYRIQMPNTFGLRCLYHQTRRGFRQANGFEVRYWKPRELLSTFRASFGDAQLSVDGFFSLNAQISDLKFLPRKYRALVRVSHALQKLSRSFPFLTNAADSVYVSSQPRLKQSSC